jgi:hypothetical protein
MNWNLEGQRVKGLYLAQWPYTGRVLASRVKFGGAVQHTVELDQPIEVYGAWRETILVDTVHDPFMTGEVEVE